MTRGQSTLPSHVKRYTKKGNIMKHLLKKLFSKKNIVVYRDGKTYKFRTFADAIPYMTN